MNKESMLMQRVDTHAEEIKAVSREIWLHPEPGLGEYQSLEIYRKALIRAGARMTEGLAGIPTAFCGEWGSGKPVIGFLGEFDALPGLSQGVFDAPEYRPVSGQECGHGCGHNNLGAGAFGAAVALAEYLQENHLPGTVRFYGCPGEEEGSGKGFMSEAGCFSDVDACLTWHPSDLNAVVGGGSLAVISVDFIFHGRSAHASSSPELGRSALDAAELMNVGANYLREHMPERARLHYAYQDAGGKAPNVVQSHVCNRYYVRAPKADQAKALYARLCKVAQGAAMMTETEVEIRLNDCVANFVPNQHLSRLLQQVLEELPLPEYTEEERALAAEFQKGYTPGELEHASKMMERLELPRNTVPNGVFHQGVVPYVARDGVMGGSTDVGDVSHCVPTAQYFGVTMPLGTPGHSWQTTAFSGSTIAEKGMLHAAKVLAVTALRAMTQPGFLNDAMAECLETTGAKPAGLMAPGQKPNVLPRP